MERRFGTEHLSTPNIYFPIMVFKPSKKTCLSHLASNQFAPTHISTASFTLKMHSCSSQGRKTLNPNNPMPFEGSRHCCCRKAELEVLALLGHPQKKFNNLQTHRQYRVHVCCSTSMQLQGISLHAELTSLLQQAAECRWTYPSITAAETNPRTPGLVA